MKKSLLTLLLLINLTVFSQTDTTGKQIAKDAWVANVENRNKPMPIWDNEGNIVGFIAVLFMFGLYYRNKTQRFKFGI
jgi:hypothetical protein